MSDDRKEIFPSLPVKHWWIIRNRFKVSIPSVVSARYLATILAMSEESARGNILPSLKAMGIIDKDGKPLELTKRWRDDSEYPNVCNEIRNKIYPSELLDAIPGPDIDREAAKRWFAAKTGGGDGLVRRLVGVYQFLSEADPSGAQDQSKQRESARPSRPTPGMGKTPRKAAAKPPPQHTENIDQKDEPIKEKLKDVSVTHDVPALHIDIQIHISSDASTDQIDQIFASMAKHLYKRGDA